jgi:hypothetical protein
MWLFCGVVVLISGVFFGLLAYVVVSTQRGEQRFRAALAQRPHLALRGTRVRTTMGLQVVSRDSEYELRSGRWGVREGSALMRPTLSRSGKAQPRRRTMQIKPRKSLTASA